MTLEQLASQWPSKESGVNIRYVIDVEAGRKRVTNVETLRKLAVLLHIPLWKFGLSEYDPFSKKDLSIHPYFEAIGSRFSETKTNVKTSAQANDALIQLLLSPGCDLVKFSYMTWLTNQHPMVERKLHDLIMKLDAMLTAYQGGFKKPTQQLLAYGHQMMGKIAFDRLDYVSASGHFAEMVDLGQELNDADIIALAMVRQGDVLRKRGRYETALKHFEAARPYAEVADLSIQGIHHLNRARLYYFLGDEQNFLRAIDLSLSAAAQVKEGSESFAYWFNQDVVLQFQASGYTALGKPEKAIETYKEIERLHPFRPLRDRGAYTIEKARASLEYGDVEKGIKLSLRGLKLASAYRSKRHIARLEATYDQVRMLPFGKDKRLHYLRDALSEVRRAKINW